MMKALFKFFGFLVVVLSLAAGWLGLQYQTFRDTPLQVPPDGLVYEVKPGATLTAIAQDLQHQGVVADGRYFRWYARLLGLADHIKAGDYLIATGTRPATFLEHINIGKVVQYSLTLVEGWTFRQVMDAINQQPQLHHELRGKTDAQIMAAIGHPGEHPEGRFLPDTYLFYRNTPDVEFLRRAYDACTQALNDEWEKRQANLPVNSPYEALILASIIEKETAVLEERFAIAGVFSRRLLKGMRLQTDPTVIYGMGEEYQGNIRRQDLEKPTPYNTYRIKGLPPTPIAMPSAAAINAALHPDATDNLYFVARGDGSHHFSATLEEHNNAVIKYQLKGRKRPFSSLKQVKAI